MLLGSEPCLATTMPFLRCPVMRVRDPVIHFSTTTRDEPTGLDASVYRDCFERGVLQASPNPAWKVRVDDRGQRETRAKCSRNSWHLTNGR